MILSIDGKNLINVSSDDIQNGVFIVPVGVTHIERAAFHCMRYMTEVILPNTITYIDDWAFCGCTSLTKVIFPRSITHIGNFAFFSCSALSEVHIPHPVNFIGDSAFYGCKGLSMVFIPNSIEYIGRDAFSHCDNIVIEIDVMNIEDHERISSLIEDLSQPIVPYEIRCLRETIRGSIEAIAMKFLPYELPEILMKRILNMADYSGYVFEQLLTSVINPETLDEMTQDLQESFRRFVQDSEHQRAIDKLNKYQQLTTQFIDTAGENGFYHSPQNQVRLVESKTRIAVANKLIVWLGGDKSIAFNADEKALLSHGCAVVSILENAGIHLDELPFHDSETEYGSKAL